MSRLKGADLGISLPATLMNFRGVWSASPSPAYAVDDVVLRNGAEYVARAVPGGVDPLAAGGAFVGGNTGMSSTTALGGDSVYQSFTVNAVTTAAAVQVGFAAASTGHFTVGIASAIGVNPGAVTWLTNAAAPTAAAAGNVTVPVPAVTLQPGVTYYFVAVTSDGGSPGANQIASSSAGGVPNGVLATIGSSVGYANGVPTAAWAAPLAGYALQFGIGTNNAGSSYWQPLGPTAPMNYRGAWSASASPAYAANDVVLDSGLLWLALGAVPTGTANEPSLLPRYVSSYASLGVVDNAATAGSRNSGSVYQAFTVSTPTTISALSIAVASANLTLHGYFGIASAIGASPSAATFLAQTAPVTSPANTATTLTLPLDKTITLQTGTTYYFVGVTLDSTPGAGLGSVGYTAAAPRVSGNINAAATTGSAGNTATSAWSTDAASTATYYWGIGTGGASYWQSLSPLQENVNAVAASGAAVTLPDVSTATMHRVTLTANTTITLPTPGAGKSFTVELVQDATGGRTVAWATPSGAVRWPGGTAPTITATANAIDVITFACIGGNNWYGFVAGQAFA